MELDLEARVDRNSPSSLRLWLRWQTCAQLLEGPIRNGLRTQFHTTQPRFNLMAQLAGAPEGLKMKELSRRMMVTGGNVTSVTDQLVAAGWVKRVTDAGDRRSYKICLTALGQRQLNRMIQKHEAWVTTLFAHLSEKDRATIYTLLGKVKAGLQEVPDLGAGSGVSTRTPMA
jgi:DNA-binding MarR family transcriptional regulator